MEELRIAFLEGAGRLDPRRRQERRDFEMIRNDKSAMANLPRMAQHHEFPKEGGLFNPRYD